MLTPRGIKSDGGEERASGRQQLSHAGEEVMDTKTDDNKLGPGQPFVQK